MSIASVPVKTVQINSGPVKTVPAGAAAVQVRPSVPWATVLPLAVVMAFADGFWMTSLRGAVGAIERTQSPFASWLRESALVLPVFVLAVLAALTVALKLFGPVLRKAWMVLATALLISVAGAAAGVAQIAASSAYDYHLQSAQLKMTDSMHGCVGGCLAQQQHVTLQTDLRAVGYGSVLLLLTNVVLVLWMVAMWGGRLNVGSARRRRADPLASGPLPDVAPAGRARDLRLIVVAGLLGSAAIHIAVVPEHLRVWPLAGEFFMLLSAAQIVVACMLLVRPHRTALLAAAVVCAGPLALWLYSRTVGLPFGAAAGRPEAVGLSDVATFALQVGALLAAVVLLRARGRLQHRPRASAHAMALAIVAVTALTVIGLAGTHLIGIGDFAGTAHPSVPTAHH